MFQQDLFRYRCKYVHPRAPVYILAFFTQYDDGTSVAEWSMYHDDNDTVIIEEEISPTSGS